MLSDYAKTLGGVSDLRVNKGRFDRAAEVTAFPRSLSKYISPPLISLSVKASALYGWWDDYVEETESMFFHLSAN